MVIYFCFFWEISHSELSEIIKVFKNPYHITVITLFVLTGFYHVVLGIQVVIEDYIHCRALRLILLFMIQTFSIVTVIAFILAINNCIVGFIL